MSFANQYGNLIAPIRSGYNVYKQFDEEPDKKRSGINRFFDVISATNYMAAGAVRGMVRKDMTVAEGVIGGLRAANPFGKGYEEGEHSYTDVLDDMGWQPTTTGGKIARGAVGFLGDVFLDPGTYLSGGTSAVVKGTGKAGAKASHGLAKGMTREMAESIITKQAVKRGTTVGADDLGKQAEKLVKEFNRLIGVRDTAEGMTLSLGNAPFGKKIFGEAADASKTIVDGEVLQKIGEATLAPQYAKLRDKVYGGQIGKLFSTKHKLYNLSKTQPETVYDFIQATEHVLGNTKDMQLAKKAIYDKAKEINLTPAETKEVIELMEDKSAWSVIKKRVNISDTEEFKNYKKQTEVEKLKAQKEVDELLTSKKVMETFKYAKEEELADFKGVYDELHDEFQSELMNLDLNKINDEKSWKDIATSLEDEINVLKSQQDDFAKGAGVQDKDIIDEFYSYQDLVDKAKDRKAKRIGDTFETIDGEIPLKGTRIDALNTFIVKPDDVLDDDYDNIIKELGRKDHVDLFDSQLPQPKPIAKGTISFTKPENISSDELKKVVKQLKDDGYINTKSPAQIGEFLRGEIDNLPEFNIEKPHHVRYDKYNKHIKKLEESGFLTRNSGVVEEVAEQSSKGIKSVDEFTKKFKDWTIEQDLQTGKYRAYPPKAQADKIIQKTTHKYPVANKGRLVDNLSKHIFGADGYISPYVSDENIAKVVDLIERGTPREEVIQYIEQRAAAFDGRSKHMFSYIAKDIGYDTWEEFYNEPMLGKKVSKNSSRRVGGGLKEKFYSGTETIEEMKEFTKLEQANAKRLDLIKKLKVLDADEMKRAADAMDAIDLSDFDDIEKIKDKIYSTGKKNLYLDEMDEVRRSRFIAEDRAINDNLVRTVESNQDRITEGSFVKFIDNGNSGLKRNISKDKPSLSIDAKTGKVIENADHYDSFYYGTIESIKYDGDVSKVTVKTDNGELVDIDIDQIYSNNTQSYYKPSEHDLITDKVGRTTVKDPSVKNYKSGEFDDKLPIGKRRVSYSGSDPDKYVGTAFWDNYEIRDMIANKIWNNTKDKYGNYIIKKDPLKMSPAEHKMIRSIIEEADEVLNTEFTKEFVDLTPKQKDFLVDKALQAHNNKFNAPKSTKIVSKEEMKARLFKETMERQKVVRAEDFFSKTHRGATVNFTGEADEMLEGIVKDLRIGDDGEKFVDLVMRDGTEIDNLSFKKVTKLRNDVNLIDPKDIINMSETSKQFAKQFDALSKDLEFIKGKINNIDSLYKDKHVELSQHFAQRAEEVGEKIKGIEVSLQHIENSFQMGDLTKVDGLQQQIKTFEDALVNDDVFETYMRAWIGDGTVEEIITKNSPDVVTTVLRSDVGSSEKVRDIVETLRKDLIDMGASEVEIGKLKSEQFENFMYNYLPHELTDDGRKLFKNKDEITKRIPAFGDDIGYGREFNEYSMSRTLKKIPDGKGGYIHNPNILEVNKYLQDTFPDILKGKNAFSENIADIYVARALKNTQLVYDHRYMNEMLEMFGDDFDGIMKEGYIPVMNYGKFKQKSFDVANVRTGIRISDDISEYVSDDAVINRINTEVTKRMDALSPEDYPRRRVLYKEFKNEAMQREIEAFMQTNFTDEIKKQIKTDYMNGFVSNVQMEGYLDDLSMPMLNVNDGQYKSMKSEIEAVQGELLANVLGKKTPDGKFKGGLVSFASNMAREEGRQMSRTMKDMIVNMDKDSALKYIDDMMEGMLKNNDDGVFKFDLERLEKFKNKLGKYDEIAELQVKNVNDAIVQKANQSRQLQIKKDQSRFLDIYDKFTHIIKLNQTTILPSFHLRNKYSNIFNNWLAVGADAFDVDFQKQAYLAMKNNGDIDGFLQIVKEDGAIEIMEWRDIFNAAKEHGAVDEGFFAKDLGVGTNSSGMIKQLPPKFDPTDTKNFIGYKKGAEIGGLIENQDRLIHFASQMSRGMSAEDAAKSVNDFLFDYSDVTAFEASVMKRIIPFYTWLRKNALLQLNQMLENPEKYRMIAKVTNGIKNMVDEEDQIDTRYVNDFAQDWVQTPFNVTNPDGRQEPVLWNPNLPYMDIGRIPNPLDPVGSARDLFTQMNPLIKTPIELLANRNVFFDQPIAREGQSRLLKSAEHVLSQNAAFPVLRGNLQKEGADLGLHRMNSMTGVKMLSYDYDKYKKMKIQEMLKKDMDKKRKR